VQSAANDWYLNADLAPLMRALPFGGHPATGFIRRAGLWSHLQRLT
jgi:hypothetical protein